MRGDHVLCTGSVTQAVQALSSGEAEFYAAVKTTNRLIGFGAVARDLGLDFSLRLWTDSGNAKGNANRRGAGRIASVPRMGCYTKST